MSLLVIVTLWGGQNPSSFPPVVEVAKHDAKKFVGVTICPRGKSSHQAPTGQPCPWSHIALDFVTGLSPSESNTVVLTVAEMH